MESGDSIAGPSRECPAVKLIVPDAACVCPAPTMSMANVSSAPATMDAPIILDWHMMSDAQRGVVPTPPVRSSRHLHR